MFEWLGEPQKECVYLPFQCNCEEQRRNSESDTKRTIKERMPSSSSSSPVSSDSDKHTSTDEDVTPKASPSPSSACDALGDQDENDNTLTMPSTSQGYQADSSPAHARSVPSSQEATSPPAARRAATPLGAVRPHEEVYYFTTDMANQAAIDIEREKEKFDSLCAWYRANKEDLPHLGTSSTGNSSAQSYVSEKGSTTPMSSQPSSHQSGTSAGAHNNGFACSPFGIDNPRSNDPLECASSPVNLDDINPTLSDFMVPSSSMDVMDPMNQNQNPMHHPMMYHHSMPGNPLNPLSFNQQTSGPSTSNPPSNQGLKRKAPLDSEDQDREGTSSSSKQAKLGGSTPTAETEDHCPMRKLELMANSQFLAGNNINEVVETSKKDERSLKMEKLEGISKSLEEEQAQAKRMAAAAAANGQSPFASPGQFPGMPGPQAYPQGMPPHPGMPGMMPVMPPGPSFSAGASYPPGMGPPGYPQFPPMFPGAMPPNNITPGGYPMSAPSKMQQAQYNSPVYPPNTPSPANMAAMQQYHQQHAARAAAAAAGQMHPMHPMQGMPGMPPHPSMMTPQQHFHFAQMQHIQMAQMAAAQKAGMSPNMMMKQAAPPPQMQPPFPPGHPAWQNPAFIQHVMAMEMQRKQHIQQQAAAAAAAGGSQGMPYGFPPMPGMPGMPGMPPHPGMMNPQMTPQMQPPPQHAPVLQLAGNRDPNAGGNGMGNHMWQLTPHYPPPFPSAMTMPPVTSPAGSGAATPGNK
ncbi:unnamed protein product [Caenorhabditis sp. 36 PRJEB53466]|nr:unnamed protein product [Caenorhabditis sp. 36 PRJEB53466]